MEKKLGDVSSAEALQTDSTSSSFALESLMKTSSFISLTAKSQAISCKRPWLFHVASIAKGAEVRREALRPFGHDLLLRWSRWSPSPLRGAHICSRLPLRRAPRCHVPGRGPWSRVAWPMRGRTCHGWRSTRQDRWRQANVLAPVAWEAAAPRRGERLVGSRLHRRRPRLRLRGAGLAVLGGFRGTCVPRPSELQAWTPKSWQKPAKTSENHEKTMKSN